MINIEIRKLAYSTDINFIDASIKSLNAFYGGRYPKISKIERAIKISEAMHYLSIYKRKQFKTLEEANLHAKENPNAFKNGRKVIYWKIRSN